AEQGGEEECGEAKITSAYNLPSKYILHTVGPMVGHEVYPEERAALRSCYTSCLDLAEEAGLRSIAFCCISTGVFNYPQEEAAEIAIGTALDWKQRHPESAMKIVFNTFLPRDTQIYQNILERV
ncbi:MAG: macro domain-containing protein, partial [Clostridia bacterium]|nr:macro domain-containing protein [Clostridia bacterium]